jgi:hypothetical protein
MISIEQIQNDIQTLPPEAQDLLIDFIQLLKKRYPGTKTENIDVSPESRSFLEDAHEFIGCLEGGPGDVATKMEKFGDWEEDRTDEEIIKDIYDSRSISNSEYSL